MSQQPETVSYLAGSRDSLAGPQWDYRSWSAPRRWPGDPRAGAVGLPEPLRDVKHPLSSEISLGKMLNLYLCLTSHLFVNFLRKKIETLYPNSLIIKRSFYLSNFTEVNR